MKLHMTIGKFPISLHHFTGPDIDGPHDHPLSFTTTILRGSYVEEVWVRDNATGWYPVKIHRRAGESHMVHAETIHRISELPEGECITSVEWHEDLAPRRQTRFWRFDHGNPFSRQWDERKFVPFNGEKP